MRLDAPWFLLLLVIPVVAAWRVSAAPRIAFPASTAARSVRGSWRRRVRWLPVAATTLAAVVAVVALARPQRGRVEWTGTTEGTDILLVVDVSSSMRESDLAAGKTRLDVVKQVVDRFIAGRDADRIGLMTFARYPRVVCPLTLDHQALRAFLEQCGAARPGSSDDGTAIGLALAAGVRALVDSDAPSKVMVLLTDGRETRHPIGQMEAARLAVGHAVRVYTVAAGRRVGKWADELAVVAEETGGRGFVARDADVLASIYEEIDALETRPITTDPATTWGDSYSVLLAAAVALMLLSTVVDRVLLRRVP